MIVVTGATGTIGRSVVRHLSDRGVNFKALVRDRTKGELLGCQYVIGDFDEPATLQSALVGVERLLLNGPVEPGMVRQQKAVIDAAIIAGASYVVRVSAAGASASSDRAINRWHAEIEAHLEASGLAAALLRPTFFMQNIFSSAPSIKGEGTIYGGFRNGGLAAIDCSDIALCGTVLLTAPTIVRGSFVLTGRETLSFAEIAAKLSARLERPIRYVDRPVSEIITSMKARGMAVEIAESFGKMMTSFAGGGASAITSGVKEITGREPRTFDEFLTENLDRFR